MYAFEAIAIGWFYLGFSGVMGRLLRDHPFGRWISAALLLLFGVYSLALPYPWPQRGLVWAAALGVMLRYASIPRALPAWAQSARFALGYFAAAMLLVTGWVVFCAQTVVWFAVGAPAICAVLLLSARAYSLGKGAV
jgi:hypothetical protein